MCWLYHRKRFRKRFKFPETLPKIVLIDYIYRWLYQPIPSSSNETHNDKRCGQKVEMLSINDI